MRKTFALVAAGALINIPLLASAATQSAAEMKTLQEENQKLAAELSKANAEIAKLKGEAAKVSSRELREVNAPLTLTPAEQANAPANVAPASSSLPQSSSNKDFTFAVGTKFWITDWSTWVKSRIVNPGGNFYEASPHTLTAKSGSELSAIPNVSLRYKDFFITGSYLAPTSYDFSRQQHLLPTLDKSGVAVVDTGLRATREEWDVSLGYQVLPYVAVTAGYKEIKQEFSSVGCVASDIPLTGSAPCSSLGFDPYKSKFTFAGPTFGISGAAPIGHGFGLYGNFNYGWLGANYRDNPRDNAVSDVDYYVGEFGFTYSHLFKELPVYAPLSSATLYAGYRYQTYQSHLKGGYFQGGDNNPKDVVQGFVSGVNLAF